MITVKLMGGLGNQMFQYASAYGIASKLKTSLSIDTSWFETSNSVAAPRSYELDCFMIPGARTTSVVERMNPFKPKVTAYKEKSLLFDDEVFTTGKNLVLDGYWQSEKYFSHVRKQILAEFSFKEEPIGQNQQFATQIRTTNAVSLHVRRGDYANHAQTNATHGLMPLEYYATAVRRVLKAVPDAHFFVFSDDPTWCQDNLPLTVPHTFIYGNQKGHQDLQLMIMCKHHVIANSSFSWWGAWLDPSVEKLVIAPKRWFNDPDMNALTVDLVPGTWERI